MSRTDAATEVETHDRHVAGQGVSAPLSGVRVLDFSHILAGPYCTRLLSDLGAEVLKVESRTRPDMTGALRPGERPEGRVDRPPLYLNTNRSKSSITLNLKTAQGVEVARRLAACSDVIVENFSAAVMDRLGLDYESLSALNPGLIYLSLSGYGHSGPRRHWTSMNMNLQAHSGLMLATGAEGDEPVSISNSWNDYIGGIHGCFAVIEALRERQQTGKGAALDISQFECSVGTIGSLLLTSAISKQPALRQGNRCSGQAPQGVYRCAGEDEWCSIVVESDEQWQSLLRLVNDTRLSNTVAYQTVQGRLDAHEVIDALLEAWTRQHDSRQLEAVLQQAGIAAVRMNRISDVMETPTAERVFPRIQDPRDIARRVTGLPIRWAKLDKNIRPAPALGEQTASVLSSWLGMSETEIQELERQGALE